MEDLQTKQNIHMTLSSFSFRDHRALRSPGVNHSPDACASTKDWRVLSRARLSATPWTVSRQAPLSMGFPSKNTGVGCRFLLQGTFLTQGLRPACVSSCLLALTGRLNHCCTWEALFPPNFCLNTSRDSEHPASLNILLPVALIILHLYILCCQKILLVRALHRGFLPWAKLLPV